MEYETISENCKIKWIRNYKLTTEKYKQVSGFIFDEDDKLLIVKSDDVWTLPGGHPELYEYTVGTLIREVLEEACVGIKNIKYLGAVEVVEDDMKYYQLRFVAKVNEIYKFKAGYETNDRKFVEINHLKDYIKWYDGITFQNQLNDALMLLSNLNKNQDI